MQNLSFGSKNYLQIIEHLNSSGGISRVIGGAVRDAILGYKNSDIDIATTLVPEDIIKSLTSHHIKVIPTGIKFGTVTAIINKESFEITTLREDISCDGRRADVKYTDSFLKDAERRDFTMNALSYCPIKNKLYDYFDGITDLKNQKVIFIGNPENRISEDYLRILRFFRFSCLYAKEIDIIALNACIEHKQGLLKLSRERIKSEIDRLISSERSPYIISIMCQHGILDLVLPGSEYNSIFYDQAFKIASKWSICLESTTIYAILYNNTTLSYKKLIELKLSKTEAQTILSILKLKSIVKQSELQVKLKELWLENEKYEQYFLFAYLIAIDKNKKWIEDLFNRLKISNKPIFPLNGNDIMSLGYNGKNIGKLLSLIKYRWISSEFTLDKKNLIESIKYQKND